MLKLTRVLPVIASALVAMALPASAETFPTKQITIMPLLAAGTGLDITVRMYAEQMAQSLGKPVMIENRPGNAGAIGIAALKAAPPDGHTLAVATSGAMAIRPWLLKHVPYDQHKDFVPIAIYVKSPFILVVDPKLPVNTVAEFIAYVKELPGKLTYSSPGVGGAPHLTMEFLKQRFGLDITHVPYRNSPQSIADFAAGHITLAFAEAGVSLPLIRAGNLRALAVSSSVPISTMPELPPIGQAVGAPDFEAVSWHVLIAHSATPRDVINQLHGEMKRIWAIPASRERTAALGLIPIYIASIEEMRAYVASENDKWSGLVRKLGLEASQQLRVDRRHPNRAPLSPDWGFIRTHGQADPGETSAPSPTPHAGDACDRGRGSVCASARRGSRGRRHRRSAVAACFR